jgi:cytochrome c oxidase cbb3-type subunit 3
MESHNNPQHERPSTRAAGNDQLSGHNYDGIQEYDNPTPGWWTWIFVASIVFSVPYFAIVTLSQGDLGPEGFYRRSDEALQRQMLSQIPDTAPTAANILKYSNAANADDYQWSQKVGGSLFATNCVTCHGRDGSGITGPNLTDDKYIHIKQVADIADVIIHGRNNNAMPAWNTRLSEPEIMLVSAYVASLRGQNLPSKYTGSQGTEIPPWSQ